MKPHSKRAERRIRTENKIKSRIRGVESYFGSDAFMIGSAKKRAKTMHPLSGDTRRNKIDWEWSEIPAKDRRKMT